MVGLYDDNNKSTPELNTELEGSPDGDGLVLNKDPVMLLNEFCQRSQQKVLISTSCTCVYSVPHS
jgi:hypothetical protein